jgi:alpha-tubulin suppressor-like RCC1 family protein
MRNRCCKMLWSLAWVGLSACGDGPSRTVETTDGGNESEDGAWEDPARSDAETNSDEEDASADAGTIDPIPPELLPVGPASLSAGTDSACRITDSGELRCWGAGNGAPSVVMPGSTFTDVALVRPPDRPFFRGCAIRTAGELVCWQDWRDAAAVGNRRYTKLALSTDTRCGITTAGTIACGDYISNELTSVVEGSGWSYITGGATHFCALKDTGALYCWGKNLRGELGIAGATSSAQGAPAAIMADATWLDVSAGTMSTCGVRSDGALFCWGSIAGSAGTPTRLGTDTDWARVSVSADHACALKRDGTAHCWGSANAFGQLGFSGVAVSTPTALSAETDWRAISVGNGFACAGKKDKSVHCWGSDGLGQLGRGTSHLSPTKVGDSEWQSVSAGNTSTCAVRMDGTLECWGAGVRRVSQTPQRVGGETKWKTVRVGKLETSACVTDTQDDLYCWGTRLGPSGGDSVLPTAMSLKVKAFSIATQHACAIAIDDSLYCWGDEGKSGLAMATSMPTQVGSDKWRWIAASYNDSCGVRADGTLWCWGGSDPIEQFGTSNQWSQVAEVAGDTVFFGVLAGTVSTIGRPNGLDPVSDVVALALAGRNQCAILSSGVLRCAGDNWFGEVGDGSTVRKTSAVATGTNSDWKMVTAGESHFCGINGAGHLYCWGRNDYGQIGDGTAYSAVPVRVKN